MARPEVGGMELFRCTTCGKPQAAAPPVCNICLGESFRAEPVVSHPMIVSWTIVRHPPLRAVERGAYVVVLAEVGEGLQVTGRLTDGPEAAERIAIGMPVAYVGLVDGVHQFSL